jgi:hypothetical protein
VTTLLYLMISPRVYSRMCFAYLSLVHCALILASVSALEVYYYSTVSRHHHYWPAAALVSSAAVSVLPQSVATCAAVLRSLFIACRLTPALISKHTTDAGRLCAAAACKQVLPVLVVRCTSAPAASSSLTCAGCLHHIRGVALRQQSQYEAMLLMYATAAPLCSNCSTCGCCSLLAAACSTV